MLLLIDIKFKFLNLQQIRLPHHHLNRKHQMPIMDLKKRNKTRQKKALLLALNGLIRYQVLQQISWYLIAHHPFSILPERH